MVVVGRCLVVGLFLKNHIGDGDSFASSFNNQNFYVMKSTIKHFLLSSTLLCFAISINNVPLAAAVPLSKSNTIEIKLDGGAYLIFAGKTGGSIAKKDLGGPLKLSLDGCPGAKESTIVSFELEISKRGKTTTLQSKTNQLTAEMLTALRALGTGDTFDFKKVMAHFPNNAKQFEVHTQKYTVA